MAPQRALWQRLLWGAAGVLALAAGIVGNFLPLLPTTPFVRLAAVCFSRGRARVEAWVLPLQWCWLPALCCAAVAWWMWRLPTSAPRRST